MDIAVAELTRQYLWSSAGYCLIAIPVFFGPKAAKAVKAAGLSDADVKAVAETAAKPTSQIAQRTQDYISNRRLLLSLADAGGRLMVSGKDMAELAGHTSRVYALLSTLHALNTDQYQSAPVSGASALTPAAPVYDLGHINGRLVVEDNVHDEMVQFDKVPIVAPAPGLERGGEELIKALELTVRPGEHVLIAGPNGVGKTGVARVLAGLWPTFEGIVRRPQSIMFLPQRPYLSLGSLRDQCAWVDIGRSDACRFIYPHSYPQYAETGRDDDDLMEILEAVNLEYLPAREGGMDTRKEWVNVFSGGEKQRVGMARLFYFRPRFAVLDECTSAVSSDVEGKMYQHAKDLGSAFARARSDELTDQLPSSPSRIARPSASTTITCSPSPATTGPGTWRRLAARRSACFGAPDHACRRAIRRRRLLFLALLADARTGRCRSSASDKRSRRSWPTSRPRRLAWPRSSPSSALPRADGPSVYMRANLSSRCRPNHATRIGSRARAVKVARALWLSPARSVSSRNASGTRLLTQRRIG